MKLHLKKFFFILFFLLITLFTHGQVVYNKNNNILIIGKYIKYYIDSNANETINTILLKQDSFKTSPSTVPNFGLIEKPIWIQLNITNKSNSPDLTLEFSQSLIDEISFYSPIERTYTKNNSGENYPFHQRMVNYHKYLYNINIKTDSTSTYFIRIKSSKEIILPIFLGKPSQITTSNLYKNLWFGIFFGVIVVMFFYNLFIYFTVEDPIYLYYVAYILILGLTQATVEGYTFQFLWPENNYLSTKAFFFFTAFINISGIEFVRQFLNVKQILPTYNKICLGLYCIYTFIIALTIIGALHIAYILLQDFAGLVSILILIISIKVLNKGYRPAKFFIIAWIPLIIGIIIYVLRDFNFLPYNTLTNYSITFGSALEVILLSFALADKINIYKKEKEISQAAVLSTLQETERIIREQNTTLERNVEERTRELETTNKNLNKTLTDLKESQTQLVEAEKMASLGQLTAGIAHEINNPINFVTSNVGPLKRDVNILVDAISNIESVGLSDATTKEKQQQIDDYKEEIELDYLKVEIDQLIKGIHEGATRTADIVRGLKIFSRLDEDDLKKADINEGLDSTLIIANNLIGSKIQVIKNLGNVPLIECYPGKLNQVFLNIISNAVFAIQEKFNNQYGGILNVTTTNDDQHLIIRIADNGTGMSEATKNKIFEPFFTTKNVGVGTGLGMSIVYNTIKKHNAEICLNSTEGVGTEFMIKLNLVFVETIAEYQSEQQGQN